MGGKASTSATPARERRERLKLEPKVLPTDLRSFFGKVSPRKRGLAESDDEGTQKPAARVGWRKVSSGSTGSSSSDSKPKLATKPAKKMEQLFLDPFDTTGHATLSCAVCAMSYARTPEDMEVHAKHHKKVVGGCDWVAGDIKGVTVLEEGVEWSGNQEGKIVMVDAGATGLVGKKVPFLAPEFCRSLTAFARIDQGRPRYDRHGALFDSARALPNGRMQALPLPHSYNVLYIYQISPYKCNPFLPC